MTKTRVRRTVEQQIADMEAKIKQLKNRGERKSRAGLGKDSKGMADLSAAIDAVCAANKASVSDVIMAIARVRRARLIITSSKNKNPMIGD